MARYFGGFRDRLLKKGRASSPSDRDVDWVKVSGTVIWSPEKRDYQWLDPDTYLDSFLARETSDSVETERTKPLWDLSALANEPDDDGLSYSERSSENGHAIDENGYYAANFEAELPSIDEYKNELLSALRRRGLRVDVRKISLPEALESDLIRFHVGQKSIDSHALRASLQLFKKQVIESFDQFSRVGETYIVPHAPRYPDFDEETVDVDLSTGAPDPDEAAALPEEAHAEAVPAEPAMEPLDSDYESFVLKSLDKLEASLQQSSDRKPAEAAAVEAPAEGGDPASSDRNIYDPNNGTLDIPRKPAEAGPRLRGKGNGAGADIFRESPTASGTAPADAPVPGSNEWLVAPVQSRKAAEAAAPPDAPANGPVLPSPESEVSRQGRRRTAAPPPENRHEESLKSDPKVAEARFQALSILSRLDPQAGDGHASLPDPEGPAVPIEAPPRFPALETIAASLDPEAPPREPSSASLSEFLLSLKNEHEEQQVTSTRPSGAPVPVSEAPPLQDVTSESETSTDLHTTNEQRAARQLEERKRTVSLFAKGDRRPTVTAPKNEEVPQEDHVAETAHNVEPEAPIASPIDHPAEVPHDIAVVAQESDDDAWLRAFSDEWHKAGEHSAVVEDQPEPEVHTGEAPASEQLEDREDASSVASAWKREWGRATVPEGAFPESEAGEHVLADTPREQVTEALPEPIPEIEEIERVASSVAEVPAEPVASAEPLVNPATEFVSAAEPSTPVALETKPPAGVYSEQAAPTPVAVIPPPPTAGASYEQDQTSMAVEKAGEQETDRRHAEQLTQRAREALEALESREAAVDGQPPAAIEKTSEPSSPPARRATEPEPYEQLLDGVVEALAFATDDPVPLACVSRVFADVSGQRRPTEAQVVSSVERLNTLYDASKRAFRVKIWAGGIRMATDPTYANYIREIYKQERPRKLSRTLMETLAIVAYSQPTTKPEVDFIRGVDSDYAIRKLLEMGLIDIVGRSEAIGKPLLYGTSERFLEQLGLSELAALPRLKEIEELLDDPSLQRERMHLLALENGASPRETDSPAAEEF